MRAVRSLTASLVRAICTSLQGSRSGDSLAALDAFLRPASPHSLDHTLESEDLDTPRLRFQQLNDVEATTTSPYCYTTACTDVAAILEHASCLEVGLEGIVQDEELALVEYERAAQLGSAEAQHRIGRMVRDGRGISQDAAFAASWLRCAIM